MFIKVNVTIITMEILINLLKYYSNESIIFTQMVIKLVSSPDTLFITSKNRNKTHGSYNQFMLLLQKVEKWLK